MTSGAPSVARETRILLIILVASAATLWILARLRFPEPPVTANPVPPVLAQLASPPTLSAIASAVGETAPLVTAALAVVPLEAPDGSPEPQMALRVADHRAVFLERSVRGDGPTDPATGLTIAHVDGNAPPSRPRWTPDATAAPTVLFTADPVSATPAIAPVLITAMAPTVSATWNGTIWRLPDSVGVTPGHFLFTPAGGLAGLVVADERDTALVPADVLLAAVDRLLATGVAAFGRVAVNVAPLTSRTASALDTTSGLVVTWVDPDGAAAGVLFPNDVIQRIAGMPVTTVDEWRAWTARSAVGSTLRFSVWRAGGALDIDVTLNDAAQRSAPPTLGLTLRRLAGRGLEIVRVDDDSAADIANLQPGDVITHLGAVPATTTNNLQRMFAALEPGRWLAVAVTRGHEHIVVAIAKPR